MTDNIKLAKGVVYFCPICGAEISIVRPGNGCLSPRCCNVPMEFKSRVTTVFFCPRCGSEAMMLVEGLGKTAPLCCNNLMNRIDIGAL